MKRFLSILIFLFYVIFSAETAFAKWPDAIELLKTLAPLAGLDPDEVEAVRFSLKYPTCASTIFTYTASQDYSLIGFIATLKTSQIQNIPSLTPLKKSNCKKSNPTENAYRFLESQGDKLLGKEYASLLKQILAEQIAQGKSEIDAQIAAIPYIGTILSNWDCACDAAFETQFPSEKMISEQVGNVLSILNFFKKGDIDSAIGKLFSAYGPKIACKFLSNYSGVESIPVVNSLVNDTCSSILGKSLGFVVDGADEVLKGLGIKGYDHMAPNEYYDTYMATDIGVPNYLAKANFFYTQCYKYFEPSSMAPSTAKKTCLILKDRYIKESIAKIDWEKAKSERTDYIDNNIIPKSHKSVFVDEKNFEKIILDQISVCEKHFKEKYPTALTFKYADKQFCNPKHITDTMWYQRQKAKERTINEVYIFLRPFCGVNESGTALVCPKEYINMCQGYFKNACVKSQKGTKPGETDMPCCQLGTPKDWKDYKQNIEKTKKLAESIDGGIYCIADDVKNPLKISCSLKESFEACQKQVSPTSCLKLSAEYKYKSGASIAPCCEYEPERLTQVKGVLEAQDFIKKENQKTPGACGLGGTVEGFGFDPRIIRCGSEAQVKACKSTFLKFSWLKKCSFNKYGYATKVCCVQDVFASNTPTTSSAEDPKQSDKKKEKSPTREVPEKVSPEKAREAKNTQKPTERTATSTANPVPRPTSTTTRANVENTNESLRNQVDTNESREEIRRKEEAPTATSTNPRETQDFQRTVEPSRESAATNTREVQPEATSTRPRSVNLPPTTSREASTTTSTTTNPRLQNVRLPR